MDKETTLKIYKRIGGLVKTARKAGKVRMTQDQLAEKLDLSRTSMVNIESGRHRISLHLLYSIADILQVKIADLLPDVSDIFTRSKDKKIELPENIREKLFPSEITQITNAIKPIISKEVSSDEHNQRNRDQDSKTKSNNKTASSAIKSRSPIRSKVNKS